MSKSKIQTVTKKPASQQAFLIYIKFDLYQLRLLMPMGSPPGVPVNSLAVLRTE